jgi:hypothetical protein
VELDNTTELVFFETVQVQTVPESISQAENAGSIPVTRSMPHAELEFCVTARRAHSARELRVLPLRGLLRDTEHRPDLAP